MKNKEIKNSFFKFIFCLIVVPIISFFLTSTVMMLYANKNIKLLGNWLFQKSNYFYDLKIFYSRNDKYSFGAIGIIIALILASVIYSNYKSIWKKLTTKNKNNEDDEQVWEYNHLTKEGMTKKDFVSKNQSDKPSWCICYLDKKSGYIIPKKKDLHACVLGTSGSGKSQKVIFPNIHRNATLEHKNKTNFIITDPKGEIIQKTGSLLKQNGYKIKIFDLENSKKSMKWNPLKLVWDILHSKEKQQLTKYDYALAYQNIQELVHTLNWGNAKEEGSIWEENAKNITIAVIKFLLLYSLENKNFKLQYFTLSNVVKFLNIATFTKGEWVNIIQKNISLDVYWNRFYSEAMGLVHTTPETLSGFLTNAQKVLNQFSADLVVEEITSNNNFDMYELLKDDSPFALFIKYPDHKKSCQFLISILISQIYKISIEVANQSERKKLTRRLLFILEEFNSIDKITGFSDWLSISRSREIFFLVALQDYEQLQKYNSGKNEHKQIKSQFSLTWFLKTENEDTLQSFSKMLGEKTIKKESSTTAADGKTSKTVSESKEPVMSIDKIKTKNDDDMIVLASNMKPMMIRPLPAYKYFDFEDYFDDDEEEIPFENIVWDFEKMIEKNLDANSALLENIQKGTSFKKINKHKNQNALDRFKNKNNKNFDDDDEDYYEGI